MNGNDIQRYGLGLSLGGLGGTVFWALGLPLPWMLGALFFTMWASLAKLPLRGPDSLRKYVIAVIGVMLGARFSPDVLGQAWAWAGTLALLVVYLALLTAIVVPWYRFVGGYDWRTAFFAGMPGGLAEMIELAEANKVRAEPVILAHSLRIVVTIAVIAVWFRLVLGHEVGAGTAGTGWGIPSLYEAMWLLLAAVFGSILGTKLNWSAPTFLGPMAVSAVLHIGGISEAAPPPMLVNLAQIILGTILGCRFRGVQLAALKKGGALSVGSTLLMLGLALIFAQIMQALFAIDPEQVILALAPGGLTEMGLIALAIHADVAFVALHHVCRILLILISAPLLFRLFDRWVRGDGKG